MTRADNPLRARLNVSTPDAPASPEEIQARLTAGNGHSNTTVGDTDVQAPSHPEPAAPPPGVPRQEAAGAPRHPIGADPPARHEAVDESRLEMERLHEKLTDVRQRLSGLDRDLAGRRISKVSACGHVRVEVDVYGAVLKLEVDPIALRGHRIRVLGRSIVETINTARAAAEVAHDDVTAEFAPKSETTARTPSAD